MRIRTEVSSDYITERDQRMAEIGNALSHPLRVALVRYLKEKNFGHGLDNVTCNKDLVEMFDYSQSTVSQHVKILRDCGLFNTESKDKFTFYYLNGELLNEYLEFIQMLCIADSAYVQAAINNPDAIILDVRTTEEYAEGHIPGAINEDWASAVNFDTDTSFKPVKELLRLYKLKGITKDKEIITYCYSGVRSAHMTFVLKDLLGYPLVKNYKGSWQEWSSHKLPVEQN